MRAPRVYDHGDCRNYLLESLAFRRSRNPGYSLRAFARHLAISPSALSEILNGKKKISLRRIRMLVDPLKLNADEGRYLTLLAKLQVARNSRDRALIQSRLKAAHPDKKVYEVQKENFNVLADWYNLAILSLGDIKGGITVDRVAALLNFSSAESLRAVQKLEDAGFLTRKASDLWVRSKKFVLFKSENPNDLLRGFHALMLKKTCESLETTKPDERFIGTQTVAVDLSQLEEARRISRRYLSDLVALFDRGPKRTAVYHIGVQLFPLGSIR